MDSFVDHPKSQDKDSVWRFFLTNKERNKAKCSKCMRIIKTEGSSTSAMHSHMMSQHKINTLKRRINVKTSSEINNNVSSTPTSKVKLNEFFLNAEKESLEEIIATMASLDGISFNLFCTSEDIRKGLNARGFKDIATSPNTIRKMVLSYAEKIRQATTTQFGRLKSEGNKFSITTEEWTSLRNSRYINVNIHSDKDTWNLGLGRGFGKLNAEKVCKITTHNRRQFLQIVELSEKKIEDFNLKVEPYIVNLTTDGATFMEKVGSIICACLQRYVIGEIGTDFSLILDCKIRWSSLFTMIKRFYKLRNCILKALIDIKSEIVFSIEEMDVIQTLIQILSQIKLAVEALCTKDANLLTANTTLTFLLENIGSATILHEKMKSALKRRISQRLTDMSNVLQYLHSGTFIDSSLGL